MKIDNSASPTDQLVKIKEDLHLVHDQIALLADVGIKAVRNWFTKTEPEISKKTLSHIKLKIQQQTLIRIDQDQEITPAGAEEEPGKKDGISVYLIVGADDSQRDNIITKLKKCQIKRQKPWIILEGEIQPGAAIKQRQWHGLKPRT